MSLMETRRISPSDGNLLRELHLRMYADSPDAFSEPLATAGHDGRTVGRPSATTGGTDAGGGLRRDGQTRADRIHRRLPRPLA